MPGQLNTIHDIVGGVNFLLIDDILDVQICEKTCKFAENVVTDDYYRDKSKYTINYFYGIDRAYFIYAKKEHRVVKAE